MQEITQDRKVLLSNVSQIVTSLIQVNNLYQERLDKNEMIKLIVDLFDKLSTEELKAIPDYELKKRIDSILVLEAVSGTLNDLTPEQIQMFEEAVKRK